MVRTILTLVSGLIVAALAACGSSPSTSSSAASSPSVAAKTPTPGPIAACKLLTVQDANQLAGETFTAGAEAGLTCTYTSGNSLVVLSVVQAPNSAAVQAAILQQQQTLGASGFTKTDLSGADSAYEFLQGASGLNVIEVVRGNNLFVIEAVGVTTSEVALKAAATVVLGRLP